ncbi:hypothetical protein BDR05DRAFT_165355 [Suillus weaverae]|nr:hypothetical protein BDR05DRAFT_165355 [Suillus weaverae]
MVALDLESVHSTQGDTLLVLFNTAISNLVLFRNSFALKPRYYRTISVIPVECDCPRSSSQPESLSIDIGNHHQRCCGFRQSRYHQRACFRPYPDECILKLNSGSLSSLRRMSSRTGGRLHFLPPRWTVEYNLM